MIADEGFSEEQKQYLQGFVSGADAARKAVGLPTFAGTLGSMGSAAPTSGSALAQVSQGPPDVRCLHAEAQERFLSAGKKLTAEEQAKKSKDPFQMWDEMRANAAAGVFPKGTDVFLYKYHGLFHVAPAQDAFMCRLRFHGGLISGTQLAGLADVAEKLAGGYADVTTRANFQLREIRPENTTAVVMSLLDLGIITRGAGADNIRNVTGTPTAGIDPQELIDTRPLTQEMHHYILQHPEMYGLPRKFNIAFDGGGTISALADTNDVGFMAVRVEEGKGVPAGVYFRLELGGITGHKDFARDCGILLKPEECVPVAAAIVRVFLDEGDRTDRKKARMKYVLDRLGLEGYLAAVQKHLKFPLKQFSMTDCVPRGPVNGSAHIGVFPQRQAGLNYVGVVLPVGRMTADHMRGVAKIANRYGSGSIRLTVWQNLLIADVPDADVALVKQQLIALGLHWSASHVRSGLVACTGNAGCKFAAANTKKHAMLISEYLEERVPLDSPINIHLTGCHHSCAQHYIGDVGLLGTKVTVGEEMVEGYHLFVGGGYGDNREIGRELFRNLPFEEIPALLEQLLQGYLAQRISNTEIFRDFLRRHTTAELTTLARGALVAA